VASNIIKNRRYTIRIIVIISITVIIVFTAASCVKSVYNARERIKRIENNVNCSIYYQRTNTIKYPSNSEVCNPGYSAYESAYWAEKSGNTLHAIQGYTAITETEHYNAILKGEAANKCLWLLSMQSLHKYDSYYIDEFDKHIKRFLSILTNTVKVNKHDDHNYETTLSIYYHTKGIFAEELTNALRYMLIAIKYDPENVHALYNISYNYWLMEEYPKAVLYMYRARNKARLKSLEERIKHDLSIMTNTLLKAGIPYQMEDK